MESEKTIERSSSILKPAESEKDVERYLCEQVKKLSGEAYKFVSPQRKFVLDRLCVLPGGIVWFVEVKSGDKVPSPGQFREIERLTQKGHHATWVCTIAGVNKVIKQMEEALCKSST